MSDDYSGVYTSPPDEWDKLKPLAREMRHQPTPAEDVLWREIRNRRVQNAKFRRQHAVEGFIVDFICVERQLIIEIDGAIHEVQQQYDLERQVHLEARGFRVLRFTNEQVFHALPAVLDVLGAALLDTNSFQP